jgi:branched-chain amino acid transport system permease protein
VAGNWIEFTGGYNGIVGIPLPNPLTLPLIGGLAFQTQTAQYYLVLAFLLLTLLIMHRLVFSLWGLSFMAIRNNEILAGSVGINTFAGKILSFVVANFFAGLAGGIYASLIGTISPTTASLELTFNWLIFLLLGGAATLAGPIIGAFAIPVIMEYLQFLAEYRLIIFGALLIVVIIYFPRGVMGAISNLHQKTRDFYERKKGATKGAAAS